MQYQINLYGLFKKINIWFVATIVLLILLFFRGCEEPALQATTIKIPEITKTLPADTVIKHQIAEVNKMVRNRKAENKYLKDLSEAEQRIIAYQEEIDNMHSEYMYSDSIKKAEMFRLATQLKRFESNFEDEHLKLTINGIIAGNEVKEVTPTYTIKERKIDVPQKQVKFRMLVGGGLGNSLTFDKPLFNGNVGFQNAKGNILRFSFDTEQRFMVGYDFSLFKITK